MQRKLFVFTVIGMFVITACGRSDVTMLQTETSSPSAAPTQSPTSKPDPTITPKTSPDSTSEYTKLQGTKGPIYSLSWSPKGDVIASAGYGQVNLWDVATGDKLTTLDGHTSFVWGVAFSPNGELIASASNDGSVRIWKVNDLSEALVLRNPGAFCLAWSPDGNEIAVGSTTGRVTVWDIETQEVLHSLKSGNFTVSVAWSPNDRLIAAGRLDGKIPVWEVESETQVTLISGYSKNRSDANGLAFSPDGTILASAHQNGFTYLWNVETWELQSKRQQNAGWARGLAWSPDGQFLVSAGEGANVSIWDMKKNTGNVVARIFGMPKWSVSWSPYGDRLAIGTGIYNGIDTNGVLYIVDVAEIYTDTE